MVKKGKSKTGNTFHGTMKKCLQLTEKTGRILQKASQDMEKLKGKMTKLEDLVVVGIKKGTAEALKEMKKETKTTTQILDDLKKLELKYGIKIAPKREYAKVKPMQEGMVKKGGINLAPVTPRPAQPKGQEPKEKPTPPPGRLLKEDEIKPRKLKPPPPEAAHQNPGMSEESEIKSYAPSPPEQTLPGSKKEPVNSIVWCELKECQLHKEVAQEKYYKSKNKKCKACMECQEMSG